MSPVQRHSGLCAASPPALAHRTVGNRREAYVVATGRAVWEIIGSLDRAAPPLVGAAASRAPSDQEAALALEYYERHPDEIDAALATASA